MIYILISVIVIVPLVYLVFINYRKRRNIYLEALERSNEAVIITDPSGNIEYVNPAFSTITHYPGEDVLNKNIEAAELYRDDKEFHEEMWIKLKREGNWQGELSGKRKGGEIYPKHLSVNAVRDKKGRTLKYVWAFSDITKLKQAEHSAHYYTITNLPNRTLYNDRLKQAVRFADRHKHLVGVMVLKLNQFENINDTLGPPIGEGLLKETAQRLLKCVSKNDTAARIERDEFALILTELHDEQNAADIAQRIIDLLSEPFPIRRYNVYSTVSIGITIYPFDDTQTDFLLRNADMAMYRAKEQVDSKFEFYSSQISKKAFQRLSIEANLREAFEREEFVLLYQPQVDLKTGQVIGMEALIRRQEKGWLAPPSEFIHLAEEAGLIVPICEWTLRKACLQNAVWQKEGINRLRLSVNTSAYQFNKKKLVKTVSDVLEETGLPPSLLELELTEGIIMRNVEETIKIMNELNDMGVSLSIDDFGTGYSSLSYLKRLPVNKLKIDIAFVREITSDPDSASIAKAIIGLAHNLQLKAIAEGVENEKQLAVLREYGCDQIQGFYFSFPLSADSFKKMILKGKRLEV
ncbi:MAG: EAL domain-containing protein [Nitrospirae bacterium]|nr:EAL domain-containing protein [Nitrospirota bacterium]